MFQRFKMTLSQHLIQLCPNLNKTKFFSYIGAGVAITLGITVGALISKNIASFLEENDLFVPSDDDDDD
ncbi:Essential MCU regulator, mitochondrial [Armadillidium vulgare]|nr:Essential MCU regulator, mitochondrial [Armadillidium vulgare]